MITAESMLSKHPVLRITEALFFLHELFSSHSCCIPKLIVFLICRKRQEAEEKERKRREEQRRREEEERRRREEEQRRKEKLERFARCTIEVADQIKTEVMTTEMERAAAAEYRSVMSSILFLGLVFASANF